MSTLRSRFRSPLRVAAAVVAAAFLLVTLTTTVVSVGRYCLTSHGGDTRDLPGARP